MEDYPTYYVRAAWKALNLVSELKGFKTFDERLDRIDLALGMNELEFYEDDNGRDIVACIDMETGARATVDVLSLDVVENYRLVDCRELEKLEKKLNRLVNEPESTYCSMCKAYRGYDGECKEHENACGSCQPCMKSLFGDVMDRLDSMLMTEGF